MADFRKPKILLIDCQAGTESALSDAGFSVLAGSFGVPYLVEKSDDYEPVIDIHELPNHAEQEIIVVDLSASIDRRAPGEKLTSPGAMDWWVTPTHGFIDPRPKAMLEVRGSFERILQNGGIFIVFADKRVNQDLATGRKDPMYRTLLEKTQILATSWSFLSALDELVIVPEDGREIRIVNESSPLGSLLVSSLGALKFTCVIRPKFPKNWQIVASNKYKEAVSIASTQRADKGLVIIFPQVQRQDALLVELMHLLPEISPHLFPDATEGKWKYHADYELPRIIELTQRQLEIKQQADDEIQAISLTIEEERKAMGWLQDLLTAHDKPLVEAVKSALKVIGFEQIGDVDEERDEAGQSRREDLCIYDQLPTLIVDIKGISGLPSDPDAFQSDKHASFRMREWERTNIFPLTIINHQRHLPPLQRENNLPFRKEIIEHCRISPLVLLTTWDLHRLVRSFQRNGWAPDQVKPLFYRSGRMEIVPCNYEYIGQIAHVWKEREAFSVVIEKGLKVGSRIGVELPVEFIEAEITSLQIEGKNVETCDEAGVEVGIKAEPHPSSLKKGTRVFRIRV